MKKIKLLVILAGFAAVLTGCKDDDKGAQVPVTEISVAEATGGLTVKAGESLQLTTAVAPDNASYKRVLFESSDATVMTVTQDGVISGVKMGDVTLRVFAADAAGASVDYPVFVDYEADITNVRTPGTLAQLLAGQTGITSLKLAGNLNDEDFATLTALPELQTLDMSWTTVTAISANAFRDAAALTSIALPATLETIGADAFRNATALTAITLDAATPPATATGAFEGIELDNIALTVPEGVETLSAYKGAAVWKDMVINGSQPGSQLWIFTALELTADMLGTNAQEPSEGAIANLLDGNTGTFFHTRWSGTVPSSPHYMTVALPETISGWWSFYYTPRNNAANKPTDVDLYGSMNGTEWILIRKLTQEADGLPTDNTTAYNSERINAAGQPFSHLKFSVNKTNTNTVFWTMSEFRIYTWIVIE